jgi:catechol 2,3-dioxygenase-like lactoylglutathione lyase family enzyme
VIDMVAGPYRAFDRPGNPYRRWIFEHEIKAPNDAKTGCVMPVRRIDHILIAMPAGREQEARAFYSGMLGFAEKAKPPQLAERGGCWFESGPVTVHLGVDKNFIAARKAHPAFIVDGLAGLETKLKQAGYKVTEDEPIEGCDRRHVEDPFGNRLELIEPH